MGYNVEIPAYLQDIGPEFTDIYNNGVGQKVHDALSEPLVVISRGLWQDPDTGAFRPASFSKMPVAPKGIPACGKARTSVLRRMTDHENFAPPVIWTTSGTRDGGLDFGGVTRHDLLRKGGIHNNTGNNVDVRVQVGTTCSIGEMAAVYRLTADYIEENNGQMPGKKGDRVTVFSSADQIDRLTLIQTLLDQQSPEGGFSEKSRNRLVRNYMQSPMMGYIRRHRGIITQLARLGQINPVHTAKALYLEDNIAWLTQQGQVKSASNALWHHPRYVNTFATCAPDLVGYLKTINTLGISINHLTVEEMILVMHQKEMNSRYGDLWLSHVWGGPPEESVILRTALPEKAGELDIFLKMYYPPEEERDQKAQFELELLNDYGFPQPTNSH